MKSIVIVFSFIFLTNFLLTESFKIKRDLVSNNIEINDNFQPLAILNDEGNVNSKRKKSKNELKKTKSKKTKKSKDSKKSKDKKKPKDKKKSKKGKKNNNKKHNSTLKIISKLSEAIKSLTESFLCLQRTILLHFHSYTPDLTKAKTKTMKSPE